ncbi:MAG: hypothetical protein ABSB01_25845 [Streptosporangiaceae bacterium]|jgi:acetoacetyl-CoA synthetase
MGELILFVVPAAGYAIDNSLRATISRKLRAALSPRHVPDTIVEVPAIPYNRTGTKLEVPVKRILAGAPLDTVATTGTLTDPQSLEPYVAEAKRRHS